MTHADDYSNVPPNTNYDLGITGVGYFILKRPDNSTVYSKGRPFKVNPTGQLETIDGFTLNLPMSIPPAAIPGVPISITPTGMVSVWVSNNWLPLGQLTVAKFDFPDQLINMNDDYYESSIASGEAHLAAPGSIGFENVQINIQSKIATAWFNQQWQGAIGLLDYNALNNKPIITNISTVDGHYTIELTI